MCLNSRSRRYPCARARISLPTELNQVFPFQNAKHFPKALLPEIYNGFPSEIKGKICFYIVLGLSWGTFDAISLKRKGNFNHSKKKMFLRVNLWDFPIFWMVKSTYTPWDFWGLSKNYRTNNMRLHSPKFDVNCFKWKENDFGRIYKHSWIMFFTCNPMGDTTFYVKSRHTPWDLLGFYTTRISIYMLFHSLKFHMSLDFSDSD